MLSPFEIVADYAFMQRALLAVLLVGAVCGVIGSFVVVRGMSFFGDALAHAVMPGIAVAFVTGNLHNGGIFVGGLVAGIASAVGIGWLTRHRTLKEDTAIGIVLAGMLALGIVIISQQRSYAGDLSHIMFGNILGVSNEDLWLMLACGLLVIAVITLLYKELLLMSFDQSLASTLKLPSEALRLLLLALIAVTIVASLQAVGVALMLAMLTTPAATAQLLTKRLHHMIFVASGLAMGSGVVGLFLSYYLNTASGATIVLTSTLLFLIVFGLTYRRRAA
jgi:manganese/iron transport system permease protein